ncbi:Cyanovirin-N [Mycena vitilis]|nr:Cyanovirin-N [Mycena vitilis]
MTTAAIVLFQCGIAAHAAPAAGGFSSSCSNIRITGFTLSATCKRQAGGTQSAFINLNSCIVNDHGTLCCQAGGNFGKSCSVVGFVRDGDFHDVGAICPEGLPDIDLDQCVGNFDGNFGCTT